jgi:uncharacterized membrane protein YfhO
MARSTNTGYEAAINLPQENLVFFSIPWDEGWSAEVNGEKVEIEKVDAGFMAVLCPEGESQIVFTYMPQGFVAGAAVSVVSVCILVGWGIAEFALKKRRAEK